MTAKPQNLAGQPDASDDLIAELAKLMAQDAQGDKPGQAPATLMPVRIPGGDSSAPVPRFDFDLPPPVAQAPQRVPVQAAPAPTPVAAAPQAQAAPEPFNFDFDIGANKPASVRTETVPTPVAGPSSPIARPAPQPVAPTDHDSIADLIAAELLGDPAPLPEPVVERVATLPVAPVAEAPARPAPQSASGNWNPTAVSANVSSQDKPARPALRALNLQSTSRPEQDRFKVAPVFGLASKPADESVAPVANEAPVVAAPIAPTPVAPAAPGQSAARTEPSFGWSQPAPEQARRSVVEPVAEDDNLGRDPIDEIESLIGSAVRVELDRPVERAAVPERAPASAALRSLATPIAPVSQPAAPSGRKLSGADEAILAAAEATGVQIGWVDTPEAEPAPVKPRRERKPRSMGMTRALAGPLVAVTLLLAAGFGLYWVLGLGRDAGPAPLLTADASPTKETPAATTESAASQQSVVFNEIDGVVPGAEEQLVSRDQTDVNEVTQVAPTADVSEEGLANRKVRTVTVRPDGTIVSGDDSVAGSNILPVARPNVPAVPGADTSTPELLANTDATSTSTTTPAASSATGNAAATPTTATPAATTAVPATPAVTPVTAGATVPAFDTSGNAIAGKTTVIPVTRPATLVQQTAPTNPTVQPTSPVNAVVNTPSTGNMLPPPPTRNTLGLTTTAPAAAVTPAVAATAAVAPAAAVTAAAVPAGGVEVDALPNNAPAYVQLASQRTEDEARATAQNMVTRYGPLFGGANMEVQRVDLGAKGIYYRVRVPATSMQDATNICTNVKAAGGDCFTM